MRFTDILTTASAIANYLGKPDVDAAHMLAAIEIVAGSRTVDDLGRPVSPLLRRHFGAQPGSTPGVRELAQRWFADLGGGFESTLTVDQLAVFRAELTEIAAREGYSLLFELAEDEAPPGQQ